MKKLGEDILFFDGGMGTLLQAQGLDTLPEIWNVTNEEAIFAIHKAYADAGCNIIKANTFGANRLKLADSGYSPEELISAGISIAKRATAQSSPLIALDIGPTGKLLAPVGDLPFEDAIEIFAQMVRAGVAAGAELILIETMSDTYEIKAAMLAAKENSDLPIMVTFSPDENGRLLTGADVQTAATLIESLGACAVGLNCGFGPRQMEPHLRNICAATTLPVIFNPNGGMPKIVDGVTVFDLSPADFAAHVAELSALGATILGGCCGTTPAHLAELTRGKTFFDGKKSSPAPHFNKTKISSYAKTVTLGEELIIIGERINPTGKPKLKAALRENNFDFIRSEALAQVSQGAQLLDVNAGLPGIDEAAMLPAAVCAVQSVTDTPLVIDTSDIVAAEAALRVYNGKPLLNSVNGKEESLRTVLPLAKKYGAAVIALALDDSGIPEDAFGRMKIAHKIIDAAAEYGIPRHDIVVDALTMTLSTNVANAHVTLIAVEELHKSGICTVLGVSNISFGLPAREQLNAGFLALAVSRGLSAAIANPANETIMSAFYVQKALAGRDPDCAAYVARFSHQKTAAAPAAQTRTLYEAVIAGMENEAKNAAHSLLEKEEALAIINTHLIPALNTAGETFATGETFLPQLLKSAASATAAFDVIRASMAGESGATRGKIVLATVHGDIHDIGKNIVKTLLENYNFDVIDLGKNVPPEEVLAAVQTSGATLVGLSALMTTTVAAMERTITLLREHVPDCKIMVGGAVLTAEYAKKMGADHYSPDAMGAVRYAEQVF